MLPRPNGLAVTGRQRQPGRGHSQVTKHRATPEASLTYKWATDVWVTKATACAESVEEKNENNYDGKPSSFWPFLRVRIPESEQRWCCSNKQLQRRQPEMLAIYAPLTQTVRVLSPHEKIVSANFLLAFVNGTTSQSSRRVNLL